jgi:hypothetical protein
MWTCVTSAVETTLLNGQKIYKAGSTVKAKALVEHSPDTFQCI